MFAMGCPAGNSIRFGIRVRCSTCWSELRLVIRSAKPGSGSVLSKRQSLPCLKSASIRTTLAFVAAKDIATLTAMVDLPSLGSALVTAKHLLDAYSPGKLRRLDLRLRKDSAKPR